LRTADELGISFVDYFAIFFDFFMIVAIAFEEFLKKLLKLIVSICHYFLPDIEYYNR